MAIAKTGVIYLQKNTFQFYSPYLKTILEFRFVSEIIRDLDVVNTVLLENLIKVFVANNKITPSNLIIVLADNAYFTKDFLMNSAQKLSNTSVPVSKELLQKQADEFIEHVPFDNVVSKTIPIKDGLKVCAANKDFYEAFAIAFEHLGFMVESILPGLVLGNGVSLRPVMDSAMASLILQKANAVRQYNLLNQQVFQPQITQETEEIDEIELARTQSKKSDKKRLYALAGIFISLLLVLVIVYMQSQTTTTPPKQPVFANTANPTPQVAKPVILATIPPTALPSVLPGSLSTRNLTVQIINASPSATIAQELLGQLDTYKFKSVNLQTQSAIGSAGTLVAFAPTTGQDIRNAVLDEVRKYESNIIVQDKQIGIFDITIVLAQ